MALYFTKDDKTDQEEKICNTDPVTPTNIMKLNILLPFL